MEIRNFIIGYKRGILEILTLLTNHIHYMKHNQLNSSILNQHDASVDGHRHYDLGVVKLTIGYNYIVRNTATGEDESTMPSGRLRVGADEADADRG